MTARTRLDDLINWYEKNRVGFREPIVVPLARKTAMRFARPKARGGPLYYRDHEIVPTPRKRRNLKKSQETLDVGCTP